MSADAVTNQSLETIVERSFDQTSENRLRDTSAVVVARNGDIIVERYAPGFDASSTFISWSMAKSIACAAIGVLVGDGLIDLDAPAPIPEWSAADDQRSQITMRHLLQMRSGLEWVEDYIDDQASDVIDMLFGAGKTDVAAWAIAKPAAHQAGRQWLYSSGTSNIVAKVLGDLLGGKRGVETFLRDRLFEPAGMFSAIPKFDKAGTWVASSFVYATARDYLAFAELFRNDGIANGERVLPAGWVTASTTSHTIDPESGQGYGLHWWTVEESPRSFCANGYHGQRIQIVPDANVSFVRLGETDAAYNDELRSFYRSIVACFD